MNRSIAAMISVALLLISSLFVPISYSVNVDQTGSMTFDAFTDHDPIRIDSNQEFDLDKDTIISFCDFAVKFFEHV